MTSIRQIEATLDDKALVAAMRNGTIMEIEYHG
jgi:hypothetical protein